MEKNQTLFDNISDEKLVQDIVTIAIMLKGLNDNLQARYKNNLLSKYISDEFISNSLHCAKGFQDLIDTGCRDLALLDNKKKRR